MRFLLLFALAVLCPASTLTTTCAPSPAPALGQGGSVAVSCNGFSVPVGATIQSINLSWVFDITYDGSNPGGSLTHFTFDLPGSDLDVGFGPATQINANDRPASGSVTITSGFSPFLAPFSIVETYDGGKSVTGATFNQSMTLVYTIEGRDTPEPGTLALAGMALIALRLLKR